MAKKQSNYIPGKMPTIDTTSHRLNTLQNEIEQLRAQNTKLVNSVLLVQLHAVNKIDLPQMTSLVKMINSPDEESQKLALETIDAILQTLLS